MELVEQLAQRLSGQGFAVQIELELNNLQQQISKHWEKGSLAAVVAAGGDGTVNAIATRTPPQVPLPSCLSDQKTCWQGITDGIDLPRHAPRGFRMKGRLLLMPCP